MKFKLLIYYLLIGILPIKAQTILFSEDFESGALPAGWTTQQQPGSSGWLIGDSLSNLGPYFKIPSHSLFAVSNDDICNCDMSNDLLISPAIDFSTVLQPELTFSAFYTGAYGSTASILISTDNITWTVIRNISTSNNWETHTINLIQYSGQSTVYIAFKHDDNNAWASGIAIDDVKVIEPLFHGTTILFEGFNACGLPTGWNSYAAQGGVGFEFATTDSISGGGFNIPPHTGCIAGINDAKYDDSTGTANISDDFLHLPKMDLTNYSSVFMDVDVFVGRWHYLILEASTDSVNWTTVQWFYSDNDWSTFTIDLAPWAGEPNVYLAFNGTDLGYTYNPSGSAFDNMHIYEPTPRDLHLSYVFPYEYMQVGKSVLRGKIENLGGDTLHSIDINWQLNNGAVHSETFTGLAFPALTTNVFQLQDSLEINTAGLHDFKIWLSNPNGLSDINPQNDSVIKTIHALPYLPKNRVVVEEYTGTWCCPCSSGADSLTAFANDHPEAIISAIHINDIMEYSEGILTTGYVSGYPSGTIDRYDFPDWGIDVDPRGPIRQRYPDRLDLVDPVEITFLQKSYNTVTRELTVEVNAEFFVDYPNEDLRLNIMITEDSLSNEFDSNYDQACSNVFPYYHRHVARATLDGAWGTQGSLPASVVAGNYSKLFTWTVPDSFNLDHLEIIGMVHRYSSEYKNRAILNANNVGFWETLTPTSIQKIPTSITSNINIYPNPFSDNLVVAFDLDTDTNVAIEVVDVIGRQIGSFNTTLMPAGRQMVKMQDFLNQRLLQEGLYFVKIQLGDKIITKEIMYKE